MDRGPSNDSESRIRALFSLDFTHDSGDKLRDRLAHTALANTCLDLARFGQFGQFTPHQFLPSELVSLLDGLTFEYLTPKELAKNMDSRAEARNELVKNVRKNPPSFVNLINRLELYASNPYYDTNNGVQYDARNMAPEEARHSALTSRVAYFLLLDLWRDVSLNIVGKGKYLIGFKDGNPISKGIKEPPNNKAAIFEAVVNWHRIAEHSISFFEIPSLERLVQDDDLWSDANVVRGYPYVELPAGLFGQLLNFGYAHRQRYSPTIHEFNMDRQRPKKSDYKTYKDGQSIASISVIDLDDQQKGLVYLIRHTDGRIAAGRLFRPSGYEGFAVLSSNTIQQAVKNPYAGNLDPIQAVGILVGAFARDMMVYDDTNRDYRVEHWTQMPSGHLNPEPIEVWLPQKRYIYNTDPNESRVEEGRLNGLIRAVSPHHISRHARRLRPGQHPSPKQLALAANAEYPVPLGSTFVKDHSVGDANENTVKQYRSRSAAAVLFGER